MVMTRSMACVAMASLSACSTLPHFDNVVTREALRPRVSDMIDEVQCEILDALVKSNTEASALAGLQNGQYVVSVNLTLDVTDNQGVNPTLSYIDPLKAMATNFTAGLNAQLSGQQHRNFTMTFTLIFDRNTPIDSACQNRKSASGLRGNLGIEEVLSTGLRYETGFKDTKGYAYKIPAIGVGTLLDSDPLTNGPALAPNFGATIDFTLIYGGGIGPSWTLTHFTGISPASGGLLSLLRTNKDTLILSFARVGVTAPQKPAAGASEGDRRAYALDAQRYQGSVQAAGKAAQDNVTRQILQRLLPP